jgi:hypothetical protein
MLDVSSVYSWTILVEENSHAILIPDCVAILQNENVVTTVLMVLAIHMHGRLR